MDIGQGDGAGGADFLLKPQSPLRQICEATAPETNPDAFWCSPSALKNIWMTTQDDMAAFAAWAYDASPQDVQVEMTRISSKISDKGELK